MSQKGFSGAMFIFCLMLLTLALLIIGCGANSDEDENQPNTGITGRIYTNREYGFQISLPAELIGWSITDDTGGMTLVIMKGLSDPPSQPSANVVVEPLSVSLTSKEYLEASVVTLKSVIKDWKEESRRTIKIGGKDGYEIIYTGKIVSDVTFKWIQQLVVKGKYGYVITGANVAEKFVEDVFLKIMATFRFLP